MRMVIRLAVLLILVVIGGAIYISSTNGDRDVFSDGVSFDELKDDLLQWGDSGSSKVVKKYRWKDSDGKWQSSDVAPPGKSTIVYVNENAADTSAPQNEAATER